MGNGIIRTGEHINPTVQQSALISHKFCLTKTTLSKYRWHSCFIKTSGKAIKHHWKYQPFYQRWERAETTLKLGIKISLLTQSIDACTYCQASVSWYVINLIFCKDVRKSCPLQAKYISALAIHLSNDGSGYWTKTEHIHQRTELSTIG